MSTMYLNTDGALYNTSEKKPHRWDFRTLIRFFLCVLHRKMCFEQARRYTLRRSPREAILHSAGTAHTVPNSNIAF